MDRFRPLNKKFSSIGKKNDPKKDEYSEIRKTHCSSESEEITITTDSFEEKKGLATKSSDQDDLERSENADLPPLYIEIQDDIERNLKSAQHKYTHLKKL